MERDYRANHTQAGRGAGYDRRLFTPGTYESILWEQEKALLDGAVARLVPAPRRLLDFACGTGRVLAHLEDRFDESVGVDIAESMLEAARPKLSRAQLVLADVTREPEAVPGPFDLVTAFRFFLNAQPALRDEALDWIRTRLHADSILFFNVHGNRWSSRQLMARIKRLQGKDVSWLSAGDVRRLVARHGLEIVEWDGRTHWAKFVYKHTPRFVWRGLEGAARVLRFPKHIAVNLYFSCRLRRP